LQRCSLDEAARQVAGGNSGFCIAITHRATHRLLCSNSSPKKTFLLLPEHCTLRSSFRVVLAFHTLRMGSRGHVSQSWRTWNRIRRPNTGRFQMKPYAGASNNGRINRVRVRACASARGDYVRVAICPTITVQCHDSGNFLTDHRTWRIFRVMLLPRLKNRAEMLYSPK
jgi:hypothetical protein